MKLWVDAQLSPSIARWFRDVLKIEAVAIRDLGLLFPAPRVQNRSTYIPALPTFFKISSSCSWSSATSGKSEGL
jgi:hypothetical protein